MATPKQIRRRGRWSLIVGTVIVGLTLGAVVAYSATINSDALLSSNVLVPTSVNVGANSFTIEVTATGNEAQTGAFKVTNVYNMDTSGSITPDNTSQTALSLTNGVNYSQDCGTPSDHLGCLGNPFVVNATLNVAAGTPAGTNGTLTVAMEGSSGTGVGTLDTGYVQVPVVAGNSPPSVAADNASVEVNEGSEATNTGTWSDQDSGDNVELTASVGTIVKSGTNSAGTWSWSYTPDDGPSDSQTVTITANDTHTTTQTTFALTVDNVPPTMGSIAGPTTVIAGPTFTYSVSATDPSYADREAGFYWAWDPGTGTFGGYSSTKSTSPNTSLISFSSCGSYAVRAKAMDKDGGEASPASLTVSTYDANFLPPLSPGQYNKVQKGQVVPVKINVGCNGVFTSGLQPSIQLLNGQVDPNTDPGDGSTNVVTDSVSNADTTGIMREVDGQYLYNLRVPSGTAGTNYTIRVQPFGATGGAIYVVIQIRK